MLSFFLEVWPTAQAQLYHIMTPCDAMTLAWQLMMQLVDICRLGRGNINFATSYKLQTTSYKLQCMVSQHILTKSTIRPKSALDQNVSIDHVLIKGYVLISGGTSDNVFSNIFCSTAYLQATHTRTDRGYSFVLNSGSGLGTGLANIVHQLSGQR